MSNLVSRQAIVEGIRVSRTDDMGGAFEDEGEFIEAVLTAAAPYIAAKALRQAAAYADLKLGDWEVMRIRTYLLDRANDLIATSAFTEMVQLGQEIEGNN